MARVHDLSSVGPRSLGSERHICCSGCTDGGGRSARSHVSATSDEDLLVAVLDEVIYLLDAAGVVPLDVELEPVDGDLEARFATIDAASLPLVGAVPKGVSLHELHLASGLAGWSGSVTLDV